MTGPVSVCESDRRSGSLRVRTGAARGRTRPTGGHMTTPSNELANLIDANRLAERALAEAPGVAIVVFDGELRVCVAGGDVLAAGADGPDDLVGRRVRDVLPAEVA